MGRIVQVQCEKCGFRKKIFAGGGLKDCDPETILEALSEEGKKTLAHAVQDETGQISMTRVPYVCPACKEVYALPVVRYMLNDQEMELYGVCPQCGRTGGDVEEGAALYCPDCDGRLTLQQTGRWD